MNRLLLSLGVVGVVGAAVALSGTKTPAPFFQFDKEARNPVTHFRLNQDPDNFQFAIVSDRTGGHRANVFAQAVEKLNILQPEFVITVGDLIEGSKKNDVLVKEWQDFDGMTGRLAIPFFYVAGNHDVGTAESTKFWQEKLGRRHYHFLYKNVLFLVLNSDDPQAMIGKEQIAYAQKTLADNNGARWTIVFIHRPLWVDANLAKNGWLDVERALEGRRYTVFCGHLHRYQKYVRNGQNYYQLATTGGGSLLRGPDLGEFDHVTWITMRKDGPLLANLMLDAIHAEDLQKPKTNETGVKTTRKPLHPFQGQAFFEGVPIPGAQVYLQPIKGGGAAAQGYVAADGSFKLTTYGANDGVAAGDYTVTVVLRPKDAQGKPGPNQLPAKYAAAATSELRATIQAGTNELVLELKK